MKLLLFQAPRFGWKTFSRILPDVPEVDVADEVTEAVVAFVHLEPRDEDPERRPSVFRHALKHLKWVANKRGLRTVVLHSFTHLAAETASAPFADAFLGELAERLTQTGYAVKRTPFGYFCSWDLAVYGDSLAKVWKDL